MDCGGGSANAQVLSSYVQSRNQVIKSFNSPPLLSLHFFPTTAFRRVSQRSRKQLQRGRLSQIQESNVTRTQSFHTNTRTVGGWKLLEKIWYGGVNHRRSERI